MSNGHCSAYVGLQQNADLPCSDQAIDSVSDEVDSQMRLGAVYPCHELPILNTHIGLRKDGPQGVQCLGSRFEEIRMGQISI